MLLLFLHYSVFYFHLRLHLDKLTPPVATPIAVGKSTGADIEAVVSVLKSMAVALNHVPLIIINVKLGALMLPGVLSP